jgi:hypothetical protein
LEPVLDEVVIWDRHALAAEYGEHYLLGRLLCPLRGDPIDCDAIREIDASGIRFGLNEAICV